MKYPTFEEAVKALKHEYLAQLNKCDEIYLKIEGKKFGPTRSYYSRIIKMK